MKATRMNPSKNIRMAVLSALLGFAVLPILTPGAAFASTVPGAAVPGTTASSAALANDAGVSQAELQAGNSWFNSDQNSTGYQNSGQLRTGNPLGGQSQVQGSLAASQSAAATDPYFASVLARYYNCTTAITTVI